MDECREAQHRAGGAWAERGGAPESAGLGPHLAARRSTTDTRSSHLASSSWRLSGPPARALTEPAPSAASELHRERPDVGIVQRCSTWNSPHVTRSQGAASSLVRLRQPVDRVARPRRVGTFPSWRHKRSVRWSGLRRRGRPADPCSSSERRLDRTACPGPPPPTPVAVPTHRRCNMQSHRSRSGTPGSRPSVGHRGFPRTPPLRPRDTAHHGRPRLRWWSRPRRVASSTRVADVSRVARIPQVDATNPEVAPMAPRRRRAVVHPYPWQLPISCSPTTEARPRTRRLAGS